MTSSLRLTIISLLSFIPLFPPLECAGGHNISFQRIKACPQDVTIRHILKDSDGFIWLGSDNQVFRYDGIHAIPYNLDSGSTDRRYILVKDMVETPSGDIIVATDCGLFSLSGKESDSAEAVPFLQDRIAVANSLALHPDGYLLIATDTSLWGYSLLRGTLSRIQIDRNPLSQTNIPAAISTVTEGVIMVATDGGIYRIEHNFRVIRLKRPGHEFPQPSKVMKTSGGLYLATDARGLWRVEENGKISNVREIEANVVTSLVNGGDSILYIGTDGDGIFKVEPTSGKVIGRITHNPENDRSLQSNQIYSLMSDKGGSLWVGHYQHGIDHTPSSHAGVAHYLPPTEDKAVRTIDILPDKSIVAGTRMGLLILTPDDHSVIRSITRPTLRSNMVISTKIMGDTIYIGTYGGGLSVLSLSSGTLLDNASPLPESMNSSHIFSMTYDPESSSMWFGTSHGLFRQDRNGLSHFTSENSTLPAGNVFCVFFDSSGKGWIATENGLAIWDPSLKKIRTDVFPEGFITKARVRQILEGKNRQLFFVLENGKIVASSLDMGVFNCPEIFSKHNIKAVAEDNKGNLWMSTSHGLLRWDKMARITLFSHDNGIPENAFIHCIPAKVQDNLWFGNSRGMVGIDTRILDKYSDTPPLVPSVCITPDNRLIDKFRKQDNGNIYNVVYDTYSKSIIIKFSNLTFDDTDPSKYEYRVNDGDWLGVPPDYTITLHDMHRGETHVYVRPLDDEKRMTTVIIDMPYSTKMWIWTTVAVTAIIISGVFIYVMSRKKHAGSLYYVEDTEGNEGDTPKFLEKNGKYATFNISKKECDGIMKRIHKILTDTKPYKNPDLKLPEVAKMAGISPNKLSYVLRQHSNIGFYDFINKYRIEEFKDIVRSGQHKELTLTAMSEKAGFSSRTSFFRCFKKIEGITPGEYIKNQ